MNETLVENSQHQIDDQNGNAQQQGQILLRLRLNFEDYLVLISCSVNLRELPGTKGAAERRLNLRDSHTQCRGPLAIYVNVHLRRVELQVAVDILKDGHLSHFSFQNRRRFVQVARIHALESDVVKRATAKAADANRRRILNEDAQARLVRKFGPQFFSDLIGAEFAL